MNIIYFSTYYEKYLQSFLLKNPGFHILNYKQKLELLKTDYFGVFGSYTDYANKLGHEAILIIPNFEVLQKQWAKENNLIYSENNWLFEIAIAQVKSFSPDVFFISSMFDFYDNFLFRIRPYCKKICSWIACPIPTDLKLDNIDMVLTSVPQFVEDFRFKGKISELLPAAFDYNILKYTNGADKENIDFSFVGGITSDHSKRKETVEMLIKNTPLELYGYGVKTDNSILGKLKLLFKKNTIEGRYRGEAWGLKMYDILKKSRITFNAHIDIAMGNRVNMRMYEATGMGTLLLTDKSKNSQVEYFVDGKEVVTYDSPEDAIEKVKYYLEHEEERKSIAEAGQSKTLKDYNFDINVSRMVEYFAKIL